MRSKLKKSNSEGFTIIEIMIVLVIAGLILLIVFLAVPALQRNARNTSRKADVAALLAAANEYGTNNNGTLITGATYTSPNVIFTAPAGGTTAQAKMGYYTSGIGTANGKVDIAAAGTLSPAGTLTSATTDYVIIATGTECNGNVSVAGSTRSITAIYEVESGANTYGQQCEGS